METAADRLIGAHPPGSAGTQEQSFAGSAASKGEEANMFVPIARAAASIKRMVAGYAHLAILDMRRASLQLAWLVASGIVISVLLVTAWLASVVGIAVWLLGQGMSWPGVLFIAAGLNVVAALLLSWRTRHLFDDAPFAATLRQLTPQKESTP